MHAHHYRPHKISSSPESPVDSVGVSVKSNKIQTAYKVTIKNY